jgi:hypothetical protein
MISFQKKQRNRLCILFILLCAGAVYALLCRAGLGIPCLFQSFWGITCPSCGASRAALALLRLDFTAAVEANPLFALAIYPLGAFLFFQDMAVCIWNLAKGERRLSFLRYLCREKEESHP